MPANTITEIHTPRQRRHRPVRVVVESAQEATHAAERDSETERQDVEIARRLSHPDPALHAFDEDEATEQRPSHGLSGEQVPCLDLPQEVRVLEPDEELGPDSSSRDGSRDQGQSVERIERIAHPAAQKEKEPEPREIREGLEDGVNRNQKAARVIGGSPRFVYFVVPLFTAFFVGGSLDGLE